jgi:hypothetical protein
VEAEKTDCMYVSRHQKAGQNHNLMMDNKIFENVAKFKYFGKTRTNKNYVTK